MSPNEWTILGRFISAGLMIAVFVNAMTLGGFFLARREHRYRLPALLGLVVSSAVHVAASLDRSYDEPPALLWGAIVAGALLNAGLLVIYRHGRRLANGRDWPQSWRG